MTACSGIVDAVVVLAVVVVFLVVDLVVVVVVVEAGGVVILFVAIFLRMAFSNCVNLAVKVSNSASGSTPLRKTLAAVEDDLKLRSPCWST